LKPKPVIEIGGKPIIWHIMKIYSALELRRAMKTGLMALFLRT